MNAWVRLFTVLFIDIIIRIVFDLQHWSPDFLVIAVVYITMTSPVGEAYFMAFLSGLVWDLIFLDMFGMHAILFLSASMCAARLRTLIWGQYAVSRLFMGFIFSGGVRFFEVLFWLSSSDLRTPVEIAQQYIISGAIVTGVVFMLIPWNMRRVQTRTEQGIRVYGNRAEI